MSAPTTKTWFISGHLDITNDEFLCHYASLIIEAHCRGESFVVGDAPGADEFAQGLLGTIPGARYRIFHMFQSPRRNVNGTAALVGGFESDEARDAAMTAASDDDIAWVRPVKSKRNSGTAKNLRRRHDHERQRILDGRKTWPRYVVGESYATDEVHLTLHDPAEPEVAHPELAIPLEPGLYERYRAAEEAVSSARRTYYEVQHELRKAQVIAEMFKDEEE